MKRQTGTLGQLQEQSFIFKHIYSFYEHIYSFCGLRNVFPKFAMYFILFVYKIKCNGQNETTVCVHMLFITCQQALSCAHR